MSSGEITARFGAAVRSLRFRLGWSQEALAERADLHRTYIAGIERGGRNITLKSAARLAEALGVSMAEMLGAEAEALAVNCAPARPRIGGKIVDILLVEDNPDDAMLALSGFREMHISTSLAKMLQRIIGEDVKLQLHLHAAPLRTRADAGMLDQVLLNLAVNARDAMPDGGRLLIETNAKTVDPEWVRLHPDASPGPHVWLSVSDTGTGIPKEIITRIFEPFFTTKAPGKGTGLGLATVFGIVKQHRGWIKVYSEPGQGANFQVFLPASLATVEAAAAAERSATPRGGTETILLVEDENRVRVLTRLILERAGYRVLEAPHGVAALQVWEKEGAQIQLLLTDMVMPEGMSGRQLAQQLREKNPKLRVVFASGYSAEIAGRELILQPGQNFIQKPCSPAELLTTVRQCLDH